MDAIFRARKSGADGSGGKITRGRRIGAEPSPYARPPPPPPPPPENPKWLLGFVGPATRTIASGAGKLISSLFRSDSSGSSSDESSAGSSSGDGSDDEISAERDDNLNQIDTALAENKCCENEMQPTTEKSETKIAIERLIMQETFTRDECNRLTQVIQSRVVEYTNAQKGKDAVQNELYDRTIGSKYEFPRAFQSGLLAKASPTYSYLANEFDYLSPRSFDLGVHSPDFHNTAVMEAKKWFEEKKSESRTKLDGDSSNPCVNVAEGEIGSPVLVAKSYMRTRPPWASPSLNSIGLKSPSALGMGTPHSFGGHSFSSQFLKRKSLMDSWDALDESRRVRFKQGEDIPIKSSVLELEHKSSPASLMHEKGEVEVGVIANDLGHLAANGAITEHEALPSGQSVVISDKTQDFGGEQRTGEEEFTASLANESIVPDSVVGQRGGLPNQLTEIVNSEVQFKSSETIMPALPSDANILPGGEKSPQLGEMMQVKDTFQSESLGMKETDSTNGPRSHGGNSSNHVEVNRSRNKILANGFPLSSSSFAVGSNGESGLRNESNNEGDSNSHGIRDDKLSKSIPVEETCELLSETSVDVPVIEDTDSLASGSHDSSRHTKKAPKIENRPVPNRSKVKRGVRKQQENRVTKYSRRIRGRGN